VVQGNHSSRYERIQKPETKVNSELDSYLIRMIICPWGRNRKHLRQSKVPLEEGKKTYSL
jgi:hypothetical protein